MPHVKSHFVPSHVACAAPTGSGHEPHAAPHELVLVFERHSPEQSWLPAGQVPSQAALLAMHAPAHSFCPDGQVPPHLPETHVAVPPAGATHGSQDWPQLFALVSLAQSLPHKCEPAAHSIAQVPSRHFAVPPVALGHTLHALPQAPVSVSSTHKLPQRW